MPAPDEDPQNDSEKSPIIAAPAHEALHILAGHGLPPDDEYQDAIEDIRRIR